MGELAELFADKIQIGWFDGNGSRDHIHRGPHRDIGRNGFPDIQEHDLRSHAGGEIGRAIHDLLRDRAEINRDQEGFHGFHHGTWPVALPAK